MNMLKAARDTLTLVNIGEFYDNTGPVGTEYDHLEEMITKMEAGNMSDAKMGRWLGWLQCAIVRKSGGRVTLEDCKKINMKWAD